MLKVKMLQCPSCGEFTLHPKRKELGFHVCVNCSTTSRWYVRNIKKINFPEITWEKVGSH